MKVGFLPLHYLPHYIKQQPEVVETKFAECVARGYGRSEAGRDPRHADLPPQHSRVHDHGHRRRL